MSPPQASFASASHESHMVMGRKDFCRMLRKISTKHAGMSTKALVARARSMHKAITEEMEKEHASAQSREYRIALEKAAVSQRERKSRQRRHDLHRADAKLLISAQAQTIEVCKAAVLSSAAHAACALETITRLEQGCAEAREKANIASTQTRDLRADNAAKDKQITQLHKLMVM